MLLFLLLIIPLFFWLIPVVRMRQREFASLRQFTLHFTAMLITCITVSIIMWAQSVGASYILITVLIISIIWGIVFQLIEQRYS